MKKKLICTISILVLAAALCSGCSTAPFKTTDSFASYYAKNKEEVGSDLKGMASDLAVLSDSEATNPNYQSNDYADLLINDSTNEVLESYHCFDRLYPASITKVMTALLTLEHGNMDDEQPDSADGEAYTDPDMEEGSEDDSSDDSIDPNEELVPIDEAPGMSAGEDVEGIE